MTPDLLSAPQRTALAITLREVEKTLRGILHDLTNDEQAILYRTTMSLSDEARPEVQRAVEQAMEQIAWLAQRFDLPSKTYDSTIGLRGSLALLRTNLVDVRKVGRYGDVHPALEAELDPALDELIALLQEISRASQA